MKADGSTAGGCWIYTGVYADGVNQAARRKPGSEQSWVAPEWGWAWPMNRRTSTTAPRPTPRASRGASARPTCGGTRSRAAGPATTCPDFEVDKPPSYRPQEGVGGPSGLAGDDPFIMQADGKGWLYAPTGLLDGPLPSHYEPQESPVANPLYRQQANPTRQVYPRTDNYSNPSGDEPGAEVFPYVFTTYRLTEHHTAGGMSRWLPYLSELQPEFFCEVSPELARRAGAGARRLGDDHQRPVRDRGPGDGDRPRRPRSPWGADDPPGRPALPLGVGGSALVTGDSANDLFGVTLDPNVHIQESKVASCDIRPGRRPTGPDVRRLVNDYRARAGITVDTGNAQRTPPRQAHPTPEGEHR